ncbi:MAG TPA: hypothetical protein VI408_13570 [Gaiellaceae bacterium]
MAEEESLKDEMNALLKAARDRSPAAPPEPEPQPVADPAPQPGLLRRLFG